MKNGEKVSSSGGTEVKTEWDGLASNVPFDVKAAEAARDSARQNEERLNHNRSYELTEEAAQIREQISQLGNLKSKTSGNMRFDAGALDVKSDKPNFERSDQRVGDLVDQLNTIEKEQFRLTHADKFREQEQARASVKASVERAQQEAVNKRQVERWQEDRAAEAAARATMTPYDLAKEKADAFMRANPVSESEASSIGTEEHFRVERLISKLDRINNGGSKKMSFLDKLLGRRDRAKVEAELRRYGYDPLNGNSHTFSKLTAGDAPQEIGQERYRDFQMIRAMMTTADKKQMRQIKKALKREGFGKIPSSWNDPSFTSEELSRIQTTMETYTSTKNN